MGIWMLWILIFGASIAYAGWTDGKYNSAIDFNGTSTYVDGFGALGNIKAVSFWIKADSLTEDVIDLNGTQTITVSSGTILANNFTSPTIYVDGKVSSTLSDTNWHHIAIMTDTNINASAVVVGKVGANYFDGILDDVRIYNYARATDEIRADYNAGKAAHLGENNQRSDGLVGHWNFEEGSGQTIYDRSGNNNDGTLGADSSVDKDDPVFAAGHDSNGPGGTGMSFDGVDDYVDVGSNASLNNLGPLTWEAWMYPRSIGEGSGRILDKTQKRLIIENDPSRGIAFGVSGTGLLYKCTGSNIFNFNEWSHIVVTWDGTSDWTKIYIYVNGSDVGGGGSSGSSPNDDSSYDLIIGNRIETDRTFDGLIDSVRIYNRALSADEIRQLYNRKKPVMELKFDEGSGTTAYDESFNSNDATFPVADGNKPEWSAP